MTKTEEQKKRRGGVTVYAIFKDVPTPDIREWKELIENHDFFRFHKKYLDTVTATIVSTLIRSKAYKNAQDEFGRDVKFYQGAYWAIEQMFNFFRDVGLEYDKRIARTQEKEQNVQPKRNG